METERPDENELLLRFLLDLVLGQWNAVVPDLHAPEATATPNSSLGIRDLSQLLSEELRTLLLHKAFVHPRKRYGLIQYGLVLLDADFIVRGTGSTTAGYFGYSGVFMYRTDFSRYIVPSSRKDFFTAVTALQQGENIYPQLLTLTFEARDGRLLTATCFIDRLLYSDYDFIVSLFSLKPVVPTSSMDKDKHARKSLMAVQQVYDYILAHREGVLPTTREFARRFGTNEYELKKEFKTCFGTSIYQHYSQVRLERAFSLLKQTTTPLPEIANQCGFDDYSGFAKAFRKRYGMSPAKARETS
ncbi:helix-turn-helix domain-containing protein [Flavobacterium sp. Sd200]|uniref:helix-turn-helix transcriptional regulator n=1 Tax=Flavobacterium sp. Sd200 TaxID=2692211 RepID=UPI001368DF93|nr:AraC family transcriptional regulator [Flavobacterium sp. Sd200]MXN91690.1 helix-turn-helix domain-containing protein [Flavobacterium sp. Sd200]